MLLTVSLVLTPINLKPFNLRILIIGLIFLVACKTLATTAHPLESLLSLEVLIILNITLLASLNSNWAIPVLLVVFTLAVAEASVGLGALIYLTRDPVKIQSLFFHDKLNKLLVFKTKNV